MPCVSATRPLAAARMGVPTGTAMSTPAWMWPGRCSPKTPVIGPLTGKIQAPPPPRIGWAGSVPALREAAAASWARIFACWLSATSSSCSRPWRCTRTLPSARALPARVVA